MTSAAPPSSGPVVLIINGGSSSVKFALYRATDPSARVLAGKIERIGLPDAVLTVPADAAHPAVRETVDAPDHGAAGRLLLALLDQRVGLDALRAIGHRVVHGGPLYTASQRVTPELLTELHRISPYDPEHLPSEILLIETFARRFPALPQVACFDTAFHRTMPAVARRLPLPRRFAERGIERYGFHGLSYAYLMEELARVAGPAAAQGRVVLAHLGNGASLAAVRGGRSQDTSMSFTPTAGVPMSTRSGDLDPGLFWYLIQSEKMTPEEINDLVHHQSGLLGVSGTSPDLRDLLAAEANDPRAAEAVDMFCYAVKKFIGAYAAVLGGLDTLVFAGGIGENAPAVRARVCQGLDFLGLRMDAAANAANAAVITSPGSPATARVIRTNEESLMAQEVVRVLAGAPPV